MAEAILKEKPKLWGIRMYKRHLKLVRLRALKEKISQSEVVRRAIELYTQ